MHVPRRVWLHDVRPWFRTLQKEGLEGDVGAVFKRFAPFLKMYRTYLNNNSDAMAAVQKRLDSERKGTVFSRTVMSFIAREKATMTLGKFCSSRGEPLESLLIQPVQRLPRYKMLLEELLKPKCAECVSKEFNDSIQNALSQIAAVAMYCNTGIAESKKYKEWIKVHLQFGNNLPFNETREIVLEGTISKMNRRGKPQRKYVLLFSDAFTYGTANSSGKLVSGLPEELFLFAVAQHAVMAVPISVTKFDVYTTKKSFTMQAKSKSVRDEWVLRINEAVVAFDQEHLFRYWFVTHPPESELPSLLAILFFVW